MSRILLSMLLRSLFSGGGGSVGIRGMFGSGWVLPMALGAAAGGAATYKFMEPPSTQHGVSIVQPRVLYRSGLLDAESLAAEIRGRGIKTVVNLAERDPKSESVCRQLNVRYVPLPVGDVWCVCGKQAPGQEAPPAAPLDISALWRLLEDPAARPVLIHCHGGVHRTGVVTALFRMRYQDWGAEDAIAEMDRFGFDSRKSKFDNVKDYLRSYGSQRTRTARSGHGRY